MASVLLVDSQTEICAEFSQTLRKHGVQVETASTTEEVLCLLGRSEFEAVVLEFNLRSEQKNRAFSGAALEIIRRIRAGNERTFILVFTSMEGEIYEKASLAAGADGFLLKKDGVTNLLSRLGAHLDK
jgi:DNA-binding response OmpR family regulator